jgi:ER lumen protein retaining receptor
MNIFRLLGAFTAGMVEGSSLTFVGAFTGDLSHLASILILLHKIHTSRSCRGTLSSASESLKLTGSAGISFKTQALYVAVFCTRYLDLFTFSFVSVYNVVMKIFFITSSAYILYLMRVRFR